MIIESPVITEAVEAVLPALVHSLGHEYPMEGMADARHALYNTMRRLVEKTTVAPKSPWRRPEDEMPDEDEYVLGWFPSNDSRAFPALVQWTKSGWWCPNAANFMSRLPDFWMPIPKPPED